MIHIYLCIDGFPVYKHLIKDIWDISSSKIIKKHGHKMQIDHLCFQVWCYNFKTIHDFQTHLRSLISRQSIAISKLANNRNHDVLFRCLYYFCPSSCAIWRTLAAYFRERDSDKDGKVNFKEFFHGLFDLARDYDEMRLNSSNDSDDSQETPAKILFAQLDKDDDG